VIAHVPAGLEKGPERAMAEEEASRRGWWRRRVGQDGAVPAALELTVVACGVLLVAWTG
jgi:hypothetical protein